MLCPQCGNEIAEGKVSCEKCGATVGPSAGSVMPPSKKGRTKVGAVAAAVAVAVMLVAGFATNGFGLGLDQLWKAVDEAAVGQGGGSGPQGKSWDGSGDVVPDGDVASWGADDDSSGVDAVQQSEGQEGLGEGMENEVRAFGPAAGTAGASANSVLEAYSWGKLSQIAAEIAAASDEDGAIEVAKKYKLVGADGKLDGTQVKSVTLTNGTRTTVQIAGFAHDNKTGGGKAGITFIFGDAIDVAPMNASDVNIGGWEKSSMRTYLNSEVMALLPEDMRKVIVPVDKLTNNVGETRDVSSVTTTSDSLWLLSFAELAGPIPATELWGGGHEWTAAIFNAEGSRYKLFNDWNVKWSSGNPALVKDYQGSACSWWQRSACPGHSDNFLTVVSDGQLHVIAQPSNFLGVVPGFCL